ncbi:CpsD/CapB family tyrosine-protein kinase [Isoptericola sp. NPDC019482]|uniref:polysaccharide biosynthesis tyrosine autokinase n=1 Tax=Isoptericola sp. NPDC019482 TaxID=3154688 RepID=UPI0034934DE9
MTFRELLHAVWFGRWFVLGALVVTLVGAQLYAGQQEVEYQATAAVQLGLGTSATGEVTPEADPSSVTSDELLARASAGGGAAVLPGQVSAAYDSGSRTMTIEARAATPEAAVAAANAVADAYVDVLPEVVGSQVSAIDEQISRVSDQIEKARATLEQQAKDPEAKALEQTGMDTLTQLTSTKTAFALLVEPGRLTAPAQAASPVTLSGSNVIGVAILLGLVAGVGLALARSALDQRVRTAAQAASIADAPVLAEMGGMSRATKESGRDGRLPVASRVATPFTESVRELRTAVQVGLEHRDHVAVVVSAADPRAPRAFVTANLAASFALSGRRTIVLSGDMRRPQIDTLLPPPADWDGPSHQLRPTRVPNLEVCPVPDVELDPADYLATQGAQDLFQSLTRQADIVVVDAPPILAAADATILGGYADGTVLVVSAGRTDRLVLGEAAERLRTNDVPLLGIAVAGVAGNRRTEYAATYGDSRADVAESGAGRSDDVAERSGKVDEPDPSSGRTSVGSRRLGGTVGAAVPEGRAGRSVAPAGTRGTR